MRLGPKMGDGAAATQEGRSGGTLGNRKAGRPTNVERLGKQKESGNMLRYLQKETEGATHSSTESLKRKAGNSPESEGEELKGRRKLKQGRRDEGWNRKCGTRSRRR